MPLITLTTDFGTRDWFVGTMKGVIARIAGPNPVVDITHGIDAGDIHGAAVALAAACPFFPHGSIHVAVVDPGVGSSRRALALETRSALFIGPDNGVLTFAARRTAVLRAIELDCPDWFLPCVSRTFHGRDIFAPVAAWLATGRPVHEAGSPVDDWTELRWPAPVRTATGFDGEIIHLDRYGNAITNLPGNSPGLVTGHSRVVSGRFTARLESCYGAVAPGGPVAVAGSTGFIELALNQGDAAQQACLHRGDAVHLEISPVAVP